MTDYARAPEVAEIAADLIEGVPDHEDLEHAEIICVWRDKPKKSAGKLVLASARKVSGIAAFLVRSNAGETDTSANRPLFVIEVARSTWADLTPAQQRALVDHELCHLRVSWDDDDQVVLSMRGHDLEEFVAIVRRHGMWREDVAVFSAEVAEQLAMTFTEASDALDGGDS